MQEDQVRNIKLLDKNQLVFPQATSRQKVRAQTPTDIFRDEIAAIEKYNFKNEDVRVRRLARLVAEWHWTVDGSPYYNIHPQIANKLSKINLDKIPAKFIEVPGGFFSVVLRFADDVPLRFVENNADWRVMNLPQNHIRSIMFSQYDPNKDILGITPHNRPASISAEEKVFMLCIDQGIRTMKNSVAQMLCNVLMFTAMPDETIPQAISRNIQLYEDDGDISNYYMFEHMEKQLEGLFKIIATTGFMANCPEDNLVVPDIISKDKEKYKKAVAEGNLEEAQSLIEKSKRHGHNGWNVGTNEMFVGESEYDPQPSADPTGKELTHSHIRTGHPHPVRYGKNKELIKIKWFRPVRVRPDLPFKE